MKLELYIVWIRFYTKYVDIALNNPKKILTFSAKYFQNLSELENQSELKSCLTNKEAKNFSAAKLSHSYNQ